VDRTVATDAPTAAPPGTARAPAEPGWSLWGDAEP
jgi:hypothetical protein